MIYFCPMHHTIICHKPGRCSVCGMRLIIKDELVKTHEVIKPTTDTSRPLLIIIALIFFVTVVFSMRDIFMGLFGVEKAMRYFMAGFFLVFSGFKLLDLSGFAEGYSTYDLLAGRIFVYGYIYPFVELMLGLLYAVGLVSVWISVFTFAVMMFSGIGVAIKVAKHETFRCACLGTFLKVPLTKVTLIEDFGMALMALAMMPFLF